jgi:hypothetical protein
MAAGQGELFMRKLGIVALCAALGGCAASSQEVQQRLGAHYVGQSTDALVRDFGPPASTFKMQSGENSYVWQLAAVTDVSATRYNATASSSYCKVMVIADPKGTVTSLSTEDQNRGIYGSICAQRLGLQHQNS